MLFTQLFQEMYPGEEFFPQSVSPEEEAVDDGQPELESKSSETLESIDNGASGIEYTS